MRSTWYVMEDGSVADPSSVKPDAAGVLRNRDGKAVAMRGDVPRSRGVDIDEREMKPAQSGPSYLTRDVQPKQPNSLDHDHDGRAGGSSKPDDAAGDLAVARADYVRVIGKKPFAGWDAATLREKIAAKAID